MGSCNFKVYIMMRGTLVAKRTKAVRGRWYACTTGGWKDARRTRIPPASDCFLGFGDGKVYILFECLFSLLLIVGFVLAGFVFCES